MTPISVIIPFSGVDRTPYLMLCLEALQAQVDGRDEILVVEQEFDPRHVCGRAIAKNRGARHERLSKPGRFNRSACINRGVEAASNKLLLVSDCDCLKAPDYLERLRARVAQGFTCWGFVKRLGRLPSKDIIKARALGNLDFDDLWNGAVPEPHGWGDAAGFTRRDWVKAGRYCEDFEGWSCEDDDFKDRMVEVASVRKDMFLRSLHLWHPAPDKKAEDSACNLRILEKRRRDRANGKAV